MANMVQRLTIVIRVTQNARPTFTLAFNQDQVSVGREPGMDVMLPSSEVSRSHCAIELVRGQFHIRDLDSRNGTYLNGHKVASHPIESGDNIQVGDFHLWIQVLAGSHPFEEKAAAFSDGRTIERRSPSADEPSTN